MPTYVYECFHCERGEEVFCKMSDMDDRTPFCCGDRMQRIIQPVYGYVQGECHYVCPVTKQGISSWKERRESFARHGLIDASDVDPAKEIAKAQKRREQNAILAASMPGFGKIDPHGD